MRKITEILLKIQEKTIQQAINILGTAIQFVTLSSALNVYDRYKQWVRGLSGEMLLYIIIIIAIMPIMQVQLCRSIHASLFLSLNNIMAL